MGKRSEFERNDRDWYGTPIKAVYPLAPWLKLESYIEPFAGDGRLIEHIRLLQPTATCVAAYDIEPQVDKVCGVKIEKWDFNYASTVKFYEKVADEFNISCFVSNPPWEDSKQSGFQLQRIIKVLSKIRPTFLLMNGNFVFNKKSADCMRQCTDVIPVGRLKWIENSPHTGKEDCAWFRFDSRDGETKLTYMHPRGE